VSHGLGQWNGSQIRLLGQGLPVEHGMFVHVPASMQSPHSQCPVAELQDAFGTVLQPVGHWPLVLKHAAPGHSQHTGGTTQSHFPDVSLVHLAPGGDAGGQGPVQSVVC